MAFAKPCPKNSFSYNSTLCACFPGYLLNLTEKSCGLFNSSINEWSMSTGVKYSATFPETLLGFDSIKKFTQSQAVFLEATLVLLLSWLLFCFFLRFKKLGDGSSIWFKVRWWISRLDFCFSTRHWLDDNKVVRKRKTELGGTFSVASWIVFVGFFAALLYQIISKRSVEVHNLRAANAPELLSFINDMEFNITTVSSMSCSHLRGLGTLVTGVPGFVDHRVFPLKTFANYSCHNTSLGPTVSLKCSNCRIAADDLYVSWQFVDLPNDPATAVGFQFNFTSKNGNDKHISFVNGILNNGSSLDNRPTTFRGPDVNVLKFHLFPRLYRNHRDLKLIQPLFHEFVPGSSILETNQLQASLQSLGGGLINTTLFINFLSAYIVEVDDENFIGPVGFFADLGGLYAISFAIFFYLLVQCEYRVKRLRNEDSVLINIRNRKKAQQHWDKLRKYVMYTWNCKILEDHNSNGDDALCGCVPGEPLRGNGSVHKRKKSSSRMDTISLNKKCNLPIEMNAIRKTADAERVRRSYSAGTQAKHGSSEGDHLSRPQVSNHSTLPLPPDLEFRADSGTDISDIRKNLQNLYEYNIMLRENLVSAQSMIEALTKKDPVPNTASQT